MNLLLTSFRSVNRLRVLKKPKRLKKHPYKTQKIIKVKVDGKEVSEANFANTSSPLSLRIMILKS